jgi:hypothetical protein
MAKVNRSGAGFRPKGPSGVSPVRKGRVSEQTTPSPEVGVGTRSVRPLRGTQQKIHKYNRRFACSEVSSYTAALLRGGR